MDRKTLLAVVLSVVIIVAGMLLQSVLFPQQKKPAQTTAQTAAPPAAATPAPAATPAAPAAPAPAAGTPAPAAAGTTPAGVPGRVVEAPVSAPPSSQPLTIERQTDLYDLTFSTNGGSLTSVKLRQFKNLDGSPVDMLFLPKTPASNEMPFALSFGDYKADELAVPFALKETSDGNQSTLDFSRTFLFPSGAPFTVHKTYQFFKGEYLFQVQITVENMVKDSPPVDFGGYAYTLTFGPQIGPHFAKLDGRTDFRNFVFYTDKDKRQDPRVGMGQIKEMDRVVTWAGVEGKYFTAIAVPAGAATHVVFDSRKLVDGYDRSSISFSRAAIKDARSVDTFLFYLGPKTKEYLGRYNDPEKNPLRQSLHLDDLIATPFFQFAWLAQPLKYILDLFYKIIPNYGIAIILLTILVKVIFLPLTFRSSESTAKMAALNPRIQEIRTRLKGKPDLMNKEISDLYRREKINPLAGCLPLLLQIPVFFALYNLLNTYFGLRGAMFIPGWIPDLSVPEYILLLPFNIPILNADAIRALPLLMVGSQLLQGKFTQPADQSQAGAQMKLMTYALPIVFLFILYNMPSGLVLYWTIQNILSIFQQLYINSLKKKRDELAAATVVVKPGPKPGMKIKR